MRPCSRPSSCSPSASWAIRIGASIRLAELREAGRTVAVIGLLEAYAPFLLVTIGMVVIGFELMAALVIGSIALATAPVLVLSITQQYRTRGPVTRTVLPLVAIDDVLAVATFGFVNELFAVFATTRAFRAAGEIRADGADATPE